MRKTCVTISSSVGEESRCTGEALVFVTQCTVWFKMEAGLTLAGGGVIVAWIAGDAGIKGGVASGAVGHPVATRQAKTVCNFPVSSAGYTGRAACAFEALVIFCITLVATFVFEIKCFINTISTLLIALTCHAAVHHCAQVAVVS
jgi:hypothetical protein